MHPSLLQALVNIRDLWPTWPTYVKRDILRTYVPEGFKVLEGRVIRAEVCGVLLEADVPVQESPKPGMRYGRRRKQAEKSQDRQQLEALLAVSVSSPH